MKKFWNSCCKSSNESNKCKVVLKMFLGYDFWVFKLTLNAFKIQIVKSCDEL